MFDTNINDADSVDSIFHFSPAPIPDTPTTPKKPKADLEKKAPKKITPLKMNNIKSLIRKYFDECDVPLNKFTK